MNVTKFTKLEKSVRDKSGRRARRQLMLAPWNQFHRAYEEYIRWQSFALWVRAIVEAEGRVPAKIKSILRRRCPGFLEQTARLKQRAPLDLVLLEWVDNHVLRLAKDEGWLDALAFYGFRDIRSQGSWAYWEHCENERKKRRRLSFPSFEEWWRSALNWKLDGGVTCAVVAKAVERYLDWQALAYWLHPLFVVPETELPAYVESELRQYSGLLEFVSTHFLVVHSETPNSWRRLLNWGKDHVLSRAKKEGWAACVLCQARVHPCYVRMLDYAPLWAKSRSANPTSPYPSFRAWRSDAESYVKVRRR